MHLPLSTDSGPGIPGQRVTDWWRGSRLVAPDGDVDLVTKLRETSGEIPANVSSADDSDSHHISV